MASNSTSTAQLMFQEAIASETTGNKEQAVELYLKLIETHPDYAPAYLNIGTLYFLDKKFGRAAEFYRQATEVDPNYCLAFFNYANALEELGCYDESISAYLRALEINPKYDDAHYNLGLAYQRKQDNRKALRHWRAFVALVGSGKSDAWTVAARTEIKRLLELDPVKVAFNNTAPARTFDPRPMLSLVR
jgi:tetratricopeptide (TPR) repeat protein